jgi:hypothetical protein
MKTVAPRGAFCWFCIALLFGACSSADTIELIPDLVDVVPLSETVAGDVDPEVAVALDLTAEETASLDVQQPDLPKPCLPTCQGQGCGESDGCGGICYDANSCDDGHDCTLDQCVPEEGVGCVHYPLHHLCESSGPCTEVVCDLDEGCLEEPLDGSCDDGDLCTEDDECVEGVCGGAALQPADCDDNNECTTDLCESQQGCLHENLAGDCTFSTDWLSGHCEEGLCIPDSVTALPCLDNDDCALLNNENLCDGQFVCGQDSQCVYSTDDIPECPTADDSQCQANLCNPEDGQCQLTPINQGLPCDDGTVCTLNDTCQDGECAAGEGGLSCFDNNPCTEDTCDGEEGCVFTVLEGGCDDGNPCTHGDWCVQGVCLGQQYLCEDGLDCTLDICDGQGDCDFGQIEEGQCLIGDSCYAAQVASGSDACLSCDPLQNQTNWSFSPPGALCPLPHAQGGCLDGACLVTQCEPGFESCDPSDENGCETDVTADPQNCGECEKPCSVGQACHDEECVDQCPGGSKACDGSCPDLDTDSENCGDCGLACLSQNDSLTGICQDAQCGLEPCPEDFRDLDGKPGNGCEYACADSGSESCDGVDNDCDGQIDEDSCDDNVDCTVDVCNVQTGCQNAPLDALCDDGNDCTSFLCDATDGCIYTDISGGCDDGDACTLNDQCVSGTCQGDTIADCCLDDADCDDGNPCTKDRCLPETLQCDSSTEPLEGVPCDLDGDGCTLEGCQAGVCTALAEVDCDGAAGVCQDAACESLGALGFACNVQQLPEGSQCDDGAFCTAGDACDEQGVCLPEGNKDCSQEAGQCSLGVCDELADQCVVFPLPDATPCDADADGCTLADACVAGQCLAGDAPDCSAVGYACNPGACLSLAADSYVCATAPGPADVACDDGLFCTENDQCDEQGNCSGQPKICPGGGSSCIKSACDEGTESCVDTPVEDGNPCDDGLGCTLVDQCVNGLCVGTQDGCIERRLNTASQHVWFHSPQEGLAAANLGSGRAVAVWRAGDVGLDAQMVDAELTKLAPTLDPKQAKINPLI